MTPTAFATEQPEAHGSPPSPGAHPPFNDWLGAASALNPSYSDADLSQIYLQRYGKPDPATLPSQQKYVEAARPVNPGVPDSSLRAYWKNVYGILGAPEKEPGFLEGVARGVKTGAANLGESVAGAAEFLSPQGHPFQAIARGAGDAMRAEAQKLAPPEALEAQPWYQKLTNPHYLGQFLSSMAVETAPSLAAFGAGAAAGSIGGLPGALVGGTAAMAGTIFLQQAGSVFREARSRYQDAGMPTDQADRQAFKDAGLAGFVSSAVNSLGIPASLVAPFRRTLINFALRYSLNIGVDAADQITQNVVAQHTFAPEREAMEGVPEAVVGSALLSTPETLLAVRGARQLAATKPSPETALKPLSVTAPKTEPLAGIMQQPTVEGAIAQAEHSLQTAPVTPEALDRAIAGAAHLETTAPAKTTSVAPILDAAIQREVARLSSPSGATLEPTAARPSSEEPIARILQGQRQKLNSQRRRPRTAPSELTPSETELVQVWRTLQEAQTPEERNAVLDRAAPAARTYLQELASRGAVHAETTPAPATEPERAVAPASPRLQFNGIQHGIGNEPGFELWTLHSPYPGLVEGSTYAKSTLEQHGIAVPSAPVTPSAPAAPKGAESSTPEISAPRSQLPDRENAELTLRAQKAKADLEIAGLERGGKVFVEVPGQGGTPEVRASKSPTAPWYKEATTGAAKLSRQRVETAVRKILEDKGRDVGKDVQRVKELLWHDRQFWRSEWAPKTDEEWAQAVAWAKEQQGEQTTIPVPPETVGSRPIIGREATAAEAPLFSKQAQTPEPEQTTLAERGAPYDVRNPRYIVQPVAPQGVFGERYQVLDRASNRPATTVPSVSREQAEDVAEHLNAGGVLHEPTATYESEPGQRQQPVESPGERAVFTEGQALFERRSPYARTLRPDVDAGSARQLSLDAIGDLDRAVDGLSTAGGALAAKGTGVRTLGLGIRRDLIRTGRLDLRGRVAKSAEDVATLAQVFRDPRFETLRYLYVKGDQIVGHEAVTSRLPGNSYAFLKRPSRPIDVGRALYEMRDRMRRLGADGYYLLHNHPSGSPMPSPDDVAMTNRIARGVPGFRGHIVINSGTYGLISSHRGWPQAPEVHPLPGMPGEDELLRPEIPHVVLGQSIASPQDVVRLGKLLQAPDDYVAILYRSGTGVVRAAQEMPVRLFMRPAEATDYLRGRAREFGASQVVAYYGSRDQRVADASAELMRQGALVDAVFGDASASARSRLGTSVAEGKQFGLRMEQVGGYRAQESPTPYDAHDLIPPDAAPLPVGADYSVAPISTLDAAIRTWLDQFVDVRRLVEGIKAAGKEVADDLNPVYREELFLGRVAQQTHDFLSDELLPLTQAMRLAKVSQQTLNEYLHARHAQEANAYLREINPDRPDHDALSGMTDAEAQRILKAAPPYMTKLADRVDAIVNRTRHLMVGYGLESQTTIDNWRSRYRHYVPLQRAGFEEDAAMGTGRGRDIRGSTAKARMGSTRAVTQILANIALQRERVIVRGEKMKPVIALAGLLMQYPNREIATLAKPAPITYADPETGLLRVVPGDVGEYRVPTIRTLNKQTGHVESRPDPAYKGRDNVVNFRVGGQDYAIIFNEQNARAAHMAKALKGMDLASLNWLLQTAAPVTRFFAAINTQYSPFFGLRNLLRDTGFAALSLSSTPLAGQRATVGRYALSALRGIYAEARAVRQGQHAEGASSAWWRRFEAAGGPTGYRDLFQSSTDRATAIETMLNPDWWTQTMGGKVLTAGGLLSGPLKLAVDRVGRPLVEWLSDYNQMMENAIRLGVFRTAVERGMSDLHAASLAKNITVNFNRKGTVTTQVGSLYAFFNASAQGSARMAETLLQAGKNGQLSRAGKAIVAGGILLGVVQAAMLELAGFGEEEPPEWQRETSFVIPLPGTERKYVSVPYPLGFNVLPNIGRLATQATIHGEAAKKIYAFLGVAMDAFSPFGSAPTLSQVLSPTATDPLIAIEENKDWRGRPIAREDYDTLRPTPGHSRAKPGASVWGLALSRAVNWATGGTEYRPGKVSPTPDQIDYLIAQFTGGIGRELGRTSRSLTAFARGEEVPLSSVPLVGQYVGSGTSQKSVRDLFYANVRELNQLDTELKGRRERGEPVNTFLEEHPDARLAAYGRLVERTVALLQKRKQAAVDRGGARDEVRRLDDQITAHMGRLNDRVQQATAP